MKRFSFILAFTLIACAPQVTEEPSQECCMSTQNGNIFGSGINILLRAPNDPLPVTKTGGPVKYLRFVDGFGNTLVPAYDEGGLRTPEGSVSGAIYTIVSSADLAAKQYSNTPEKTADYTAAAWEHVLVNAHGLGPANITITLPSEPDAGDRVRVSEVSGEGIANNVSLLVSAIFAATNGGYYGTSPYLVAPDENGYARPGATIELEYVTLEAGNGWVIVHEGYQVPRP